MKRAILAAGVSVLALAGCSTITGWLNPEAEAIITDAEKICAFAPDYNSVLALIPVYGQDAENIAAMICADLPLLAKRNGARVAGQQITVIVGNVVVTGHMIR